MRLPLFDPVLIAIVALALPTAALAQGAQPSPVPQRLIEPPPREPTVTQQPKAPLPGIANTDNGVARPAGAVDPSSLDLSKGK